MHRILSQCKLLMQLPLWCFFISSDNDGVTIVHRDIESTNLSLSLSFFLPTFILSIYLSIFLAILESEASVIDCQQRWQCRKFNLARCRRLVGVFVENKIRVHVYEHVDPSSFSPHSPFLLWLSSTTRLFARSFVHIQVAQCLYESINFLDSLDRWLCSRNYLLYGSPVII